MTFEIEVGHARRAVNIAPAGPGAYRIVVDGVAHHVLAERVGDFGLSLIADASGGQSRELTVVPTGTPGQLLVGFAGRAIGVSVNGRRRRAGGDTTAQTDGEQAVLAPMPGRVVRVMVAPGDQVSVRQGVVVVEAMKMENELRSPKAGRVKDVSVTPGALVEAGRVLVVIE